MTMKDIVRLSGYFPGAVSRALNDQPGAACAADCLLRSGHRNTAVLGGVREA